MLRLKSAAVALATALSFIVGTATVAQATEPQPLTLTYFDCDSGAALYVCTVSFSGGAQPVSIRWTVNNTIRPEFNDQTFIRFGCQPGTARQISVVLLDARGTSAGDGSSYVCSRIQQ
jgi:hypothetical protein